MFNGMNGNSVVNVEAKQVEGAFTSIAKYYRPEWTCGRYNAKHHIALMYNLLEGVVHYFEDISADVISEILSVPRNEVIDISRLIGISGLGRDLVEGFLNELVNVGLLATRIFSHEEIMGIRKMICENRKSSIEEFASIPNDESNQETGLEMSTAEMRYAHALKEDRIITSVMLELTYNCSEQCIHCYNIGASRNESERSERHLLKEMSLSDYKNAIDDLYNQGLVKICLTGGDPFSKPCIWELIDYVFKKEIAFDIFTNGQMLVGYEEKLANYYPRLVGISIYSAVAEVHDFITRRQGSYAKSEKVLDALCNLGVPLNVKCCIMRPNLKTYRSVLALAKKYNAVPQLEINVTDSVSGDKCVSTFLRLTESEYRVVLRDYDIPLYVGKESKYFLGAKRCMSDKACGAGENSMCITPDGECIPCCTFHYSFGNIKTASLEEILSSDKRRWWLSCTLDNFEECARHDYCDYCNLCPGVNFSDTKTPLKAGENNCFLAKIRSRLTHDLVNGTDPLKGKLIDEAIAELDEPQIGNISRIRYNE